LPNPAYVLASALIAGMVIGFSLPPDSNLGAEESIASVQNFFSADEALL
jgi:hypothetical protein